MSIEVIRKWIITLVANAYVNTSIHSVMCVGAPEGTAASVAGNLPLDYGFQQGLQVINLR